ncbi:MAG: hypothetical protein NZM31_10430, partial [Gemmatales bacterium]|nr:hypothetical protein [Gemmatales bacterium]MDW8387412.1 hypothetical protein [Gemmatales bacterium]
RLLAHPEYLPIESPYDHISWRPGRPVLVSPVSVRPLTLLQSPAVSLFSRIQLTIQRWIQDAVQPKQDHQVLTELDQAIRKLEEIKKAGDAGDASQEAIDKAKLAKTVLEEYEKVRSNADAAVAAAEAAVRENNTRANREARDKALADAKKRIQEAERVIISRARYFENTYRIDEVLRNHNVEQSMREEILRTLEQSADRIDPKTKEPVGRPDDRDFRKAAEKVYPRTEKKEQDALYREMRDAWRK